jgi:polar amino acid transport system substrate-binding protein
MMILTTPLCRYLSCLFAAWLAAGAPARAADVAAYTEESPPYHYLENGKAAGVAVDLLRAACERAKLSCNIEVLPWARAMALTKLKPNALLFSLVRTPEREGNFVWLSPVVTEPVWLFGRPDSPAIQSTADLSRVRVGVVNGSSGADFLRAAGVPPQAIDAANGSEANLRKFALHRVDFFLSTESRMQRQLNRQPLPFKVSKVLQIADATSYYAMHPQSSPETVQALRTALDELRNTKPYKDKLGRSEPAERSSEPGAGCSSRCHNRAPAS